MTLPELIDAAKRKKGTLGVIAEGLGVHQNRLGEWKKGARKPDAHEIAYLAECAGLPILETVAEIESQLDDRYAHIWREALGKMKAAGIAVSFAAVTLAGALSSPDASANPVSMRVSEATLYIMSTNVADARD